MSLISVYLVSHNYERFLENCILSLIKAAEDFEELVELSIIDDNSSDNSIEIVEKYRHVFTTVIVNSYNEGLIKSANKVIKKLNGEYIVRVDADDFVEENFIREFVTLIQNGNYDLVYPDYYLVDELGRRIAYYERSHHSHISKFNRPFHGAFTFIKRAFLEDIDYYDEDFSRQDGYYLWLQSVIMNKSVVHLKKPLFNYRQHRASLSSDKRNLLDTRYDINYKYLSPGIDYNDIPVLVPLEEDELISDRINAVLRLKEGNRHLICLVTESLFQRYGATLTNEGFTIYIRDPRPNYTYVEDVITYVTINKLEAFLILEPDYPLINPKTIVDIVLTAKFHNYDVCNSLYAETGTFMVQSGLNMKRINRTNNTITEVGELFKISGGLKYFKNCSVYFDYVVNGNENFSVGHIEVDRLSTIRLKELLNLKLSVKCESEDL